ncbi:hypothetical protein ACP4OV_002382 [Aristida adscensionis]
MHHLAIHNTCVILLLAFIFFIQFLGTCPFFHPLIASAAAIDELGFDRRALFCLKSQLHDPSRALASWRDDSTVFCNWHGVKCGRQHASRVIALDLESENLTGSIFPCVANLSFLERIHMPNNQLSGHISSDIGNLARLRYLNLSMNSLTGEVPQTISSCSRLEIIDLYSNSLEGEIPSSLAQCSYLRTIVFSNNNLKGSIPRQLGLLKNLTALFFLSNQLQGSIPEFLGSSRYLRWVNLQNNSLSGRIPPALFNSTSLSYVDLSYNDLSGSIPPFSQASSLPLQYLSLSENNLSGKIPQSLGNLTSLSSLLLDHNNLQGGIPDVFSKLAGLQEIDLNYNNLSGTVPPALYNISSLSYLSIGANQLVGRLPTNVGFTLPSIIQFVLEGNQFEGPIPASLASASNLKALNLRTNAFTGIIPSLGSLSMLNYLDLGENKLEAGDWTFLTSLANCTQLQILWLDRNNLQGKVPSFITNISKTLKVLVLIENNLSGTIPADIGNFINLTVLQMDRNLLSGCIPDTIGNLRNLSILSLSQNNLSGNIPESIGKLDQLTELYLEENHFTGLIPSSLGGCKHLTRLNISSNSIYGSIPQELFSISTLSEGLDLSDNKLSGDIPLNIGRLINLNSLSLSNNQLSGEIPYTLGECLLLDSLKLEANFLEGSIPKSLNNLQGIKTMDISQNNLSGAIPKYFESFSSLQLLNISFNNFEGAIPVGGVFANSSRVFIQGNSNLCGSSPILQVPLCETSPPRKKRASTIAVVVPLATVVAVTMACFVVNIFKRRKRRKQLTSQSLNWNRFRCFSYDDLFKATDGFSPSCLAGSGTFGLVYKGQFKFEARNVAIKVFKLDQFGAPNNFMAECEALRNIRHRNLIRVISLCSTFDPSGNEFKALILEYMSNGNLESWLHPKACEQKRPLSLGSRITVAVDVAAALDYLHNRCSPPLIHCDLKPSNILLDDEMVACLSDFGLAKFLSSDSSTEYNNSSSVAGPRGSVGYIAPEYGIGCKVSSEGDIYSYGIILLEMIAGKQPTDQMFKDGLNLRNFIESSLPEKIHVCLDSSMIIYHEGEDGNQAMEGMRNCAMNLAKLGLKCSSMSSKDRPTIQEVYAEIMAIREEFSALHY